MSVIFFSNDRAGTDPIVKIDGIHQFNPSADDPGIGQDIFLENQGL
jgi:hypothetical protein